MTDAFPTVGFFRQGYNPEAVDAFLGRAVDILLAVD